jgi:hypothetical protein
MAKKKKTRQYKVLAVSNTLVEECFVTAGSEVEVSKEYYDRVAREGNKQLQTI